jgi:hypothetical protein
MTLVRRCAHGHKRYSPDDNVVLGELAPPVMVVARSGGLCLIFLIREG